MTTNPVTTTTTTPPVPQAQNSFTPTAVPMGVADPQSALQNEFYNTPAYQMYNGTNSSTSNPLQNYMNSPVYNLLYGQGAVQNFQNSPGYQYDQQQAALAVQNNYAANGLAQSGAFANALQDRAEGVADQDYSTWQQNQSSLYNNYANTNQNLFSQYQNQLMGLVNVGNTNSGATNAYNQGSTNATNTMTTGSNIGASQLATGSNISGLLTNQGVLDANAMLGTGAAQSNNLFRGAGLLAQLNANQAASAAGTAGSAAGGQGAMNGASGVVGNAGGAVSAGSGGF